MAVDRAWLARARAQNRKQLGLGRLGDSGTEPFVVSNPNLPLYLQQAAPGAAVQAPVNPTTGEATYTSTFANLPGTAIVNPLTGSAQVVPYQVGYPAPAYYPAAPGFAPYTALPTPPPVYEPQPSYPAATYQAPAPAPVPTPKPKPVRKASGLPRWLPWVVAGGVVVLLMKRGR